MKQRPSFGIMMVFSDDDINTSAESLGNDASTDDIAHSSNDDNTVEYNSTSEGNNLKEVNNCKKILQTKFQIKDLWVLKYFLGIESSENHRRRRQKMDEEEVNKLNELNKDIIDQENEVQLDGVMFNQMLQIQIRLWKKLQNETPGGSIYWEPHVEGIPIPVKGTYYDTIDEALDMYTKYAKIAGFEIKKGGQRVENSELVAMFWADEVAKCNYKEFGDIVSFDAIFNSNKYNMKFVPFIGIDNHEKCVTLGLGMLLHKDTKSYTWLLNAFMTAFSHEPTMIVTDQDGAMKRAMEAVFKKAKYRLCMWHIM
ncbi:FAR1-related sequence 5-like protein [Tanacetum coccineum]